MLRGKTGKNIARARGEHKKGKEIPKLQGNSKKNDNEANPLEKQLREEKRQNSKLQVKIMSWKILLVDSFFSARNRETEKIQ